MLLLRGRAPMPAEPERVYRVRYKDKWGETTTDAYRRRQDATRSAALLQRQFDDVVNAVVEWAPVGEWTRVEEEAPDA